MVILLPAAGGRFDRRSIRILKWVTSTHLYARAATLTFAHRSLVAAQCLHGKHSIAYFMNFTIHHGKRIHAVNNSKVAKCYGQNIRKNSCCISKHSHGVLYFQDLTAAALQCACCTKKFQCCLHVYLSDLSWITILQHRLDYQSYPR